MHSYHSANAPTPDDYAAIAPALRGDQMSQAVMSFMYEAGLLFVSNDDSVVVVVRDGALASCQEVLAYDEPEENKSAVEALDHLNHEGLADCARDTFGRRVYRLSFKGRAEARSLLFAKNF